MKKKAAKLDYKREKKRHMDNVCQVEEMCRTTMKTENVSRRHRNIVHELKKVAFERVRQKRKSNEDALAARGEKRAATEKSQQDKRSFINNRIISIRRPTI